jgi:RNA-directed DNA polymerase
VVTAPSRDVLEGYVIPRLAEFLAGRGLELSQAKTRIVHIDDGFDFLGFNLRHFPNGKLLVRPRRRRSPCTAGGSPPSSGPTGRCRRPR